MITAATDKASVMVAPHYAVPEDSLDPNALSCILFKAVLTVGKATAWHEAA